MARARTFALGTALGLAAVAGFAQAATAAAPRNAFGQPDLSGAWSNATLTPLTRNARISAKAKLTAAEAKSLEVRWAKALADSDETTAAGTTAADLQEKFKSSDLLALRPDFAGAGGDTGGYNTFWIDPGTHLVEIDGEYRTSILTTPDGMPPKRKASAPLPEGFGSRRDVYDSYEDRSLGERCISGFGRNAGPPMLPNGYYNNNYQIVQAPNTVAIVVELIHDVRLVHLNAQHRTDGVRPAMGDSIGHYDGDTLIVETTNIPERENFMGSWKNLKVTERFTRVSPTKIVYSFQINDPEFWDKPWGGEMTFQPLKGGVYEYACHEGNYALPGILAGARHKEQEAGTRTGAATTTASKAGG